MGYRICVTAMLLVALSGSEARAQGPGPDTASRPAPQGMRLDLTKAFHTSSAWQLVVTEGPTAEDYGGNAAPGALTLCLQKGPPTSCATEPVTPTLRKDSDGPAWEPHYLLATEVVYPHGPKAAPLLLIVTGSLNSGDGDQIVATQLVAYDASHDRFRRVYEKSTGRNNNQEVRFVTNGPLRGDVITAEPQEHLPYGYWIVVNRLTPAGAYRQVLRYPSATRYNDGNPLAVIDSEMPTIESRLGVWKSGQPIPTPGVGGNGNACLKPTLRRGELWCS